jgi:dynein heavy chain
MDKILANLLPEGERTLKEAHVRCLFFGNYMEPDADPKIYDEVNQLIFKLKGHVVAVVKAL